MLVSVIPIGNSRGIRIPKSILMQLDINEKVELEVLNKEIVLRPVKKNPREGWEKAFSEMHRNGDDSLFLPDIMDEEEFQWEW